jgi:hypothetical protein
MICACIFYCFIIENVNLLHIFHFDRGPGWLNELGSWITLQLIAYHQYGMGSRPAL